MTSVTSPAGVQSIRDPLGDRASRSDTLEQERGEVFAGLLQAMREVHPDPDHLAACNYLLLHLARTRRPS